MQKIYLTHVQAIDPADGQIKTWAGMDVEADSEEDAQDWLDENGYAYMRVVGVLTNRMPCVIPENVTDN